MELVEPIETINKRLKDYFGIDSLTGLSIWRVVWSEDQFENRYGTYDDISPAGIFIRRVTEVRYVPKYRQWVKEKYVLERLVVIPEINASDLPSTRVSYENIYTFEDKNDNYLPPRFDACEFVINTIYAAQYGTHNLKKYVDKEYNQEASLEDKRKRVDEMINELFGEQSSLQGTTVTGESIIVPQSYNKR